MDYMEKCIRRRKIAKAICNIFAILMILIFVFTLALGLIFYEDPMIQYNNGIHAEDGGRWTYDGFMISKNRSRSRYSYHCDTCGRSLVLDKWMK